MSTHFFQVNKWRKHTGKVRHGWRDHRDCVHPNVGNKENNTCEIRKHD